ncbi:MAG: hypothetical protein DCF25_08610 [Leptolyngbya foveolarum]|uniref:Uncharacterized protein n=1 Tax=Leptolyngbya foveolarum TaxID=47253 RepID=A0A2W4WAC7_9CYAN|nr:MAG: hypothetical protein DCF25_08610 [Leptolyngbya foveolarum]
MAIAAPEFNAYVFLTNGSDVLITGKADAGSEIDIYRVEFWGESQLREALTNRVPAIIDGDLA